MNKQADIFTIEIIKNALVAIGEEMFLALKRSSKSPIIYESLETSLFKIFYNLGSRSKRIIIS